MAVLKPRQAETFHTEVSRLNHESIAAFNRGDVSGCASLYAEDATMLLPDQPPIKGRTAIREFLEGLSAGTIAGLVHRIIPKPDAAPPPLLTGC